MESITQRTKSFYAWNVLEQRDKASSLLKNIKNLVSCHSPLVLSRKKKPEVNEAIGEGLKILSEFREMNVESFLYLLWDGSLHILQDQYCLHSGWAVSNCEAKFVCILDWFGLLSTQCCLNWYYPHRLLLACQLLSSVLIIISFLWNATTVVSHINYTKLFCFSLNLNVWEEKPTDSGTNVCSSHPALLPISFPLQMKPSVVAWSHFQLCSTLFFANGPF